MKFYWFTEHDFIWLRQYSETGMPLALIRVGCPGPNQDDWCFCEGTHDQKPFHGAIDQSLDRHRDRVWRDYDTLEQAKADLIHRLRGMRAWDRDLKIHELSQAIKLQRDLREEEDQGLLEAQDYVRIA